MITILGAGNIGSFVASCLATYDPKISYEVNLVDIKPELVMDGYPNHRKTLHYHSMDVFEGIKKFVLRSRALLFHVFLDR